MGVGGRGVPVGVYLPGGVPAQGVYLPRGLPAGRCTCPGEGVYLLWGVPARVYLLGRGCTCPEGCTCPGAVKISLRVISEYFDMSPTQFSIDKVLSILHENYL